MCDFPLPSPVESPPVEAGRLPVPPPFLPPPPPPPPVVEAPRLPVPPPRMPDDRLADDKAGIAATIGSAVATALTTGKNAAMFLISHPVTPYAVGITAALGLCYYSYKWSTSGDNESPQDNQRQEQPQEDDSKDKDE